MPPEPGRGTTGNTAIMRARVIRARLAHAALILVGLLVFLYPLTVGASPRISCRGVQMHPGDSCVKAQDGGVQTYEQRARTANQAKPVVLGVGLLVAGFGTLLLVADVRRGARPPEQLSA
jgi:hypothetical protein